MNPNVTLTLATEQDAELIHRMKYEAFLPLYEIYRDDETSPVKESIDKVIWQLTHPNSHYYLIKADDETVGAVRVRHTMEPDAPQKEEHISPIFIVPKHQNKGIAQIAMRKLFELYPDTDVWSLATIKQEARDCHFYEKLGFVRTESEKVINDKMTIIGYEKKGTSKSQIFLRALQKEDYPFIDIYMQELHALHVNARPDLYAPLEHPYSEQDFLDIVEDKKHLTVAVVDETNTILGFGIATIKEKSGMIPNFKTAYIDDIFVRSEYRHQGLAKRIFEDLERRAKEQGAKRIDLMVWAFNEPALSLYQSLGMKPQRHIFEKPL